MTTLDYSNQNLTVLPEIPEGTEFLNCSNNQLTHLPKLPSTLKTLYCASNLLTSLPSLPEGLHTLNCSFNRLNFSSLPNSLTSFVCSFNNLSHLPELPPFLKTLKCDHNNLTHLPQLPETLESLVCKGNKLTIYDLPILPLGLEYIDIGQGAQDIKFQQYNKQLKLLGRQSEYMLPTYNKWKQIMYGKKSQSKRIDDIAIAFSGAGLSPYVVSQIINQDLKIPAWTVYEIQEHIRPILYREDEETGRPFPTVPLPQVSRPNY